MNIQLVLVKLLFKVLAHRGAPYSLSDALDERFGVTRVLAVTTLYGVLCVQNK